MKFKLLFLLSVCFTVVFFASCTSALFRAIGRGDAGVYDYLYFPESKILKSGNLYELKIKPDAEIENRLMELLKTDDVSDFIAKTKTQALLVIKDDAVIFEKYGNGFNRESTVTSFSVAKSFDSAMIGKLIEQKKLKSVNDSITDYLPELLERNPEFSKIKICHLLNMCSGISYSENFFHGDNTKTYYDPDLRKLALKKTKIKSEPATHFLYNNYNPLLIGLIIERTSGMSVSEYMEQNIWQPMGAGYDCSWSLDSSKDAFEKMESGINGTAIDFARFGCLYLNKGSVNGAQVISEEWIMESKADHFSDAENFYNDSFGRKIFSAENGGYYSYFWYGLKRNDFDEDDFFAAGNKSQIIYVSPKAKMVIVRFGEIDGIDFWKWISAFYNLTS